MKVNERVCLRFSGFAIDRPVKGQKKKDRNNRLEIIKWRKKRRLWKTGIESFRCSSQLSGGKSNEKIKLNVNIKKYNENSKENQKLFPFQIHEIFLYYHKITKGFSYHRLWYVLMIISNEFFLQMCYLDLILDCVKKKREEKTFRLLIIWSQLMTEMTWAIWLERSSNSLSRVRWRRFINNKFVRETPLKVRDFR